MSNNDKLTNNNKIGFNDTSSLPSKCNINKVWNTKECRERKLGPQ